MKRIISILLAVVMLCSVTSGLAITASAAEPTVARAGASFGDFEYTVLNNGTAEISRYLGYEENVEIPSKIDGYKVTSIGENAFYETCDVENVVIPDSVKTICDFAFSYCYQLKQIAIPDSVTSIGDYAFYFCELVSVTIGKSVKTIGKSAFEECLDLISITVDADNTNFTSIDGVLFNDDCTSIIKYPEGKTNTSYVIPDSVTSIGKYVFYYCRDLTSITIGKNVATINEDAFSKSYSLESINVDPNNTNFTSIDGVLFNDDCTILMMYPKEKTDTSYIIPDSVISINKEVFYGCDSLTSITIGKSMTTIDKGTFYGSNITEITIPDSVTSIGVEAFSGCDSLTSITIGNGVTTIGKKAFQYCKNLTSITIPDKVTSIGDCAFYYCDKLKSATLGQSVKTLGKEVFYRCARLASITIGKSVISMGKSVFSGCDKLTNINVDSDNTTYSSVDGVLFNYVCTTLIMYPEGKTNTAYTIPNNVKSIGDYAFMGCDKLTSITIPNSVTNIGKDAFSDCKSLTSIKIPDKVTNIGKYAFYNCNKLKSITIGKSLKTIGKSAFSCCSKLTDVYYGGIASEWDKISIGSDNSCLKKANIHLTCTKAHKTKKINVKKATYFEKGYTGDNYCVNCKKVISKGKSTSILKLAKPKVVIKGGKNSITVKYTKVKGATGFQVKAGSKVVTFNTEKSAKKIVKNLSKGTYKVQVRAIVNKGKNTACSSWTNARKTIVK